LDWNHIYAVTDDGYVYRSNNGGASWTIKLSLGSPQFNESSWLRSGIGWIVGETNTIYLTKDFGDTWSLITGPTDGAGDNLNTVHVTPDGTVFMGNNAGEVYGSFNEGAEWSTLPAQGVTPAEVTRIRGYDDSHIWMTVNLSADDNGRVLRSTDGGAQFTLWDLNLPANTGLNALFIVDPNYVYTGGDEGFLTKASSQISAAPN
jgi:photosystem II stability/assembly factor-like uncharacterized protein